MARIVRSNEIMVDDEHLIIIQFNNSHAKNHFRKEIEKLLRDSEALTD